jgi:hypothetical protein
MLRTIVGAFAPSRRRHWRSAPRHCPSSAWSRSARRSPRNRTPPFIHQSRRQGAPGWMRSWQTGPPSGLAGAGDGWVGPTPPLPLRASCSPGRTRASEKPIREMIADRTKAALRAAKARGVRLGRNWCGTTGANGAAFGPSAWGVTGSGSVSVIDYALAEDRPLSN